MKLLRFFICGALIFAPGALAGPIGSFSGSFATSSFSATCINPLGAPILPTTCLALDIPLTATGSTSLFADSGLTIAQTLIPGTVPPFPFSGTFTLVDLSNPTNSIFGTLAGVGVPTGPPGPPTGFPPFQVTGLLTTTGGKGAFVGATGFTQLVGAAIYETLNESATLGTGDGALTFTAVPEPASRLPLGGRSGAHSDPCSRSPFGDRPTGYMRTPVGSLNSQSGYLAVTAGLPRWAI